jgi:hypothetical protein
VDPDPEAGFSGQSYVGFADEMHGWMILKVSRSTAVSFGVMFRSEDGGKTWKQLPQPPLAEPFRFVTAKDGWLAGGPENQLYVTRDAGNSWQSVSLRKPNQIGPDRGAVYDLPVFENASNALLPVRYKMGSELVAPTTIVALFETHNGGVTWALDRIQPKVADPTDGWLPVAVAESTLVTAMVSTGNIRLMQTPRGGQVEGHTSAIPRHALTADQLSFVTAHRGWVLAGYWLLSTSDGGATWADVTPDPAGTVPAAATANTAPRTRSVRTEAQKSTAKDGVPPTVSNVSSRTLPS